MGVFGAIAPFPSRQYSATALIQSNRLDQLVNDSNVSARRNGEQALTRAPGSGDRTSAPSFAAQRSFVGRLARQSVVEARAGAESAPTQAGARGDASHALETARQGSISAQKGALNAETDRSESRNFNNLSAEEEKAVRRLRARDREVRAHEQAHKSVGGRYAGAISYVYQNGPDNRRYAVGGEVPIDVTAEKTPEATIAKMRVVIAAALAPPEPSAQDRAVAQMAKSQLIQAINTARAERQAEAREAREGGDSAGKGPSDLAGTFAAQEQDNPYTVLVKYENGG